MLLKIDSTKVSGSFKYQGTQQEAEEDLLKVKEWLNPQSVLKAGTLRLVKNWDGSFELKRRMYYCEFWKWGFRDTGRAELFLNSLIEKANSNESEPFSQQKDPQEAQSGLLSKLASYLTPNFKKIGSTELKRLCLLRALKEAVQVDKTGLSSNTHSVQESFFLHKDDSSQDPYSEEKIKRILSASFKHNINLSNCIGEGGLGKVYDASLGGLNANKNTDSYVIKIEKELVMKPIKEAGKSLHQRGDFSASAAKRLCAEKKQLSRIVAPAFVMIALRKEKNAPIEYHYVSAIAAESFANAVAQKYPQAQVATACQLMEKAKGNELWESICGDTKKGIKAVDFSPSGKSFKEVMNQIFENAEMMTELGYLNGDFKSGNLMHDPKTHQVRMIDHGPAILLGEKETVTEKEDTISTVGYRSPNRVSEKAYNQREDFYARAVTLLFMIDPVSCNTMTRKKVCQNVYSDPFAEMLNNQRKKPSEYLQCYLEGVRKINPNAKIIQELKKPEHAEIKELINLSFQASPLGEEGEVAYEKWKKAFHAWQQKEGFGSTTS